MANLHRVVYLSAATGEADTVDLRSIAHQCQRNNSHTGVTGLLMFIDGSFLQVIEGESGVITELLETLRSDHRHKDITIIEEKPVEARLFPQWCMEVRKAEFDNTIANCEETFAETIKRIERVEGEMLLTVFLQQFFDSAQPVHAL